MHRDLLRRRLLRLRRNSQPELFTEFHDHRRLRADEVLPLEREANRRVGLLLWELFHDGFGRVEARLRVQILQERDTIHIRVLGCEVVDIESKLAFGGGVEADLGVRSRAEGHPAIGHTFVPLTPRLCHLLPNVGGGHLWGHIPAEERTHFVDQLEIPPQYLPLFVRGAGLRGAVHDGGLRRGSFGGVILADLVGAHRQRLVDVALNVIVRNVGLSCARPLDDLRHDGPDPLREFAPFDTDERSDGALFQRREYLGREGGHVIEHAAAVRIPLLHHLCPEAAQFADEWTRHQGVAGHIGIVRHRPNGEWVDRIAYQGMCRHAAVGTDRLMRGVPVPSRRLQRVNQHQFPVLLGMDWVVLKRGGAIPYHLPIHVRARGRLLGAGERVQQILVSRGGARKGGRQRKGTPRLWERHAKPHAEPVGFVPVGATKV